MPCQSLHPLSSTCSCVGSGHFLGSQVFLGPLPLIRGGSCLASFLRPTAQSPVQLCLLTGTQEQERLHHRHTLLPLAPSRTCWDFPVASDLPLLLLVSSLSILIRFRFRNWTLRLPSLAENNVTGPVPLPTNYGISHISKTPQRTMPCGGRGRFSCPGMEKNQMLSQRSPNEITI